jgi:nicotinamide-nucleotide amidase
MQTSSTSSLPPLVASIITIGDELLIGQVIDTNSAWMAQALNSFGIPVVHRVAVGDSWEDIRQALDQETQRARIVLLTGGLGPTADDITKPLLCEYFQTDLILHEPTLKFIEHLFAEVLKRPMIERNRKQAEIPAACKPILNKRGTAPGMWFERNGIVVVSMPGVPHEMKGMMTDDVLPQLSQRFTLPHMVHRTLLTAGVGESFLAEKLIEFEKQLSAEVKLAYLPNYGMVRLRLSAIGPDKASLETLVEAEFSKLQFLVNEFLVTTEDEPIQRVVGRLLMARQQKIATAESCTGGYIAHLLTETPGASAYFVGSVVSYANSVKSDVLRVPPTLIDTHGAVSEAVATAMVQGVLQIEKEADYAIAVSGILGPDGGTEAKPVGTVWIAVGNRHRVEAKTFQFRFDRKRNMELTANTALDLMRRFMLQEGAKGAA